jgi:hypothetical protein
MVGLACNSRRSLSNVSSDFSGNAVSVCAVLVLVVVVVDEALE